MNNLKIKSLKDKANAQGFLSMYRLGSTGHLCIIDKMRLIHQKLAELLH
jgi:hypothetical protein